MKTLIGKKYIAVDNSYCLNLTNQDRDYRLAGTYVDEPKEATIISEPYKEVVESVVGGKKEYEFINVEYEGDTIRVLYHENAVDANLNERINENRRRWWYI